jgi:pyruvate formate lyase activating enzyme
MPTLDFARRMVRLGKRMWIRYVLVPGVTDSSSDILGLADFITELGGAAERIEVLPFHQMGAQKWKALGLRYRLDGAPTPTPSQIADVKALFASRCAVPVV